MVAMHVAANTTPMTPHPTMKMMISLMAPPPEHQRSEAEDGRYPQAHEHPLLLTARKPERYREQE